MEGAVGLSGEDDAFGERGADVGEEEDLLFGGGVEVDALVHLLECVDMCLGVGWVSERDAAEEECEGETHDEGQGFE